MSTFRLLNPTTTRAMVGGISKATLYRWIHGEGIEGQPFPKPIRLSKGKVAFREDEVRAWLDSRPRALDNPDTHRAEAREIPTPLRP